MTILKYISIILILLYSSSAFTQTSFKYEKEERISREEFPANALDLLQLTLPKEIKKEKYYKEQSKSGQSYEAKLKYNCLKYSIEFSSDGTLEDVEITIKPKDIPHHTLERITHHLSENYNSYRLIKAQRQFNKKSFADAKETLESALSNDVRNAHSYELEAEVRSGKKRYFIEITFDQDGVFTQVRTIIHSSYDHVLY